jgi:hypothetical protein
MDAISDKPVVRRSARRREPAWTERDDVELEYGKLHEYTPETALEEESKIRPYTRPQNIWAHWNEGRPTKLARWVYCQAFSRAGFRHQGRELYATVKLQWSEPYLLTFLSNNRHLLPSITYQSEWHGVYRLFCPNKTIERVCGSDSTGTLYIGKSGTGAHNWSQFFIPASRES